MKKVAGYSVYIFLCIGVFFLPLWVQVLLFVLALFLLEKKYFLIIPALIADVLYMPQTASTFPRTLLAVVGILILVTLINNKTRLHI